MPSNSIFAAVYPARLTASSICSFVTSLLHSINPFFVKMLTLQFETPFIFERLFSAFAAQEAQCIP
jgi:hypothetical protein